MQNCAFFDIFEYFQSVTNVHTLSAPVLAAAGASVASLSRSAAPAPATVVTDQSVLVARGTQHHLTPQAVETVMRGAGTQAHRTTIMEVVISISRMTASRLTKWVSSWCTPVFKIDFTDWPFARCLAAAMWSFLPARMQRRARKQEGSRPVIARAKS